MKSIEFLVLCVVDFTLHMTCIRSISFLNDVRAPEVSCIHDESQDVVYKSLDMEKERDD